MLGNETYLFSHWADGGEQSKVINITDGLNYTAIFDKVVIPQLAPGSPGVPTNIRGTSGYKQLSLYWDIPVDSGNSTVTYYKVYYMRSMYNSTYSMTLVSAGSDLRFDLASLGMLLVSFRSFRLW